MMIDCSHGNSQRDPRRQAIVAGDISAQLASGSSRILGVMLESHLLAGRQDAVPGATLRYGQSITDACIGIEETDEILRSLAAAVRQGRLPPL